jgi:5'-3' exonuclease
MTDLPRDALLLIDLSCWVWRFTHTVKDMAPWQLCKFIGRCIDRVGAKYACACGDHPDPSFRAALFKEYKAGRDERPEAISRNLAVTTELFDDMLGIRTVEVQGFEADDIIATFARKAADKNVPTIIIGVDKDLMQLIREDPPVVMWDGKNAVTGPKEVMDKFGVLPLKMIEYQALVGDKTDNIPGVTGIGPKRALKLLNGTSRGYRYMTGFAESLQLVTLNRHANVDVDLKALRCIP